MNKSYLHVKRFIIIIAFRWIYKIYIVNTGRREQINWNADYDTKQTKTGKIIQCVSVNLQINYENISLMVYRFIHPTVAATHSL